jgi:peroxiredoxin Q/BCP
VTANTGVSLGRAVPDFRLPGSSGEDWRLKDARGKKLVLYFYPRDNTPGCTLEARDFGALQSRFARAGAQIVGVSRDSVTSHQKFRDKMSLPFELLADEEEKVCRMFDVIREKNMYGRRVMGIERSTFLLDAGGVLRHEWRKVKVTDHAHEVLAAAEAL